KGRYTEALLKPRGQPVAPALFAMHQMHGWATSDGRVPVHQSILSGMRRQAADGVDTRLDADVLAVYAYDLGAVDQSTVQGAFGLVADNHDLRLRTPEIVPQVMNNPPTGTHSCTSEDDRTATDRVELHRLRSFRRLMQIRLQLAQAAIAHECAGVF